VGARAKSSARAAEKGVISRKIGAGVQAASVSVDETTPAVVEAGRSDRETNSIAALVRTWNAQTDAVPRNSRCSDFLTTGFHLTAETNAALYA
jgi:hypothetical protein